MPHGDTLHGYDAVTRAIHWLTALLVFGNIALALYARGLPTGNDPEVAHAALVYSLHKTTGVTVLGLTLLRILWALARPGPGLLHPDRRIEAFVALTVHWALYGALLVMPVAGWLSHAANSGYAPILWPLGQSLPLVSRSPTLVRAFDTVHYTGALVLYAVLGLHVAGALKHALIDRDATLARMTRGVAVAQFAPQSAPRFAPQSSALPFLIAALLWAGVVATGLVLYPREAATSGNATATASGGNWAVGAGSLTFSLRQLGSPVEGRFSGWSAAITFDEATGAGAVSVTIPLAAGPEKGLSLGPVTPQALGPEFFDAANHSEAIFEAVISPATDAATGASHAATGTLTLRGATVPVTLPFSLRISGDRAEAQGTVTLDRRDFAIGTNYPDETTVGFAVTVSVALTATRH